jgi:hypothetical protein
MLTNLLIQTDCYCSQTLPESSKRSPGVTCNTPCSGNSSESCGAAYLVDAYDTKTSALPSSGYLGCFADPGKVNNLTYTSTYMTRNTCDSYCQARSYPFAMTTQGSELRSVVAVTTRITSNQFGLTKSPSPSLSARPMLVWVQLARTKDGRVHLFNGLYWEFEFNVWREQRWQCH